MAGTTSRTDPLAALLRREVGELRRRETRRVFDPVVYVGRLAAAPETRASFVISGEARPVLDRALRAEVVARLLEDSPGADTAWLVRPGDPEPWQSDTDWLVAAETAFAAQDAGTPAFWVVTRYGWRDPRTGASRTWRRLRL